MFQCRDSISRPSTMRNWINWVVHVNRKLFLETTQHPKVKGWIRGNTTIGPALEVAVSHQQGRYGIEIMINSFFGDGTCSWVIVANGMNKYVTEMMEETQENHVDDIGDGTWKPVAEAGPKQTSMPTTSSPTVTLPYRQLDWIDVEPGQNDKSCYEVSKKMIRLLRHNPSVLRERILAPMFRSEFTSSQHWSIRTWLNYLQKGGGPKKRFQYCVDPHAVDTISFLRAIQGHSAGRHINPTLIAG